MTVTLLSTIYTSNKLALAQRPTTSLNLIRKSEVRSQSQPSNEYISQILLNFRHEFSTKALDTSAANYMER